ncbi:antitoxin [Rheinheimera marina]|uniref:Antitoxin n=1 Tax=Rheinheimera marina TaxID=1774958 RepID=A0ABV9JKN5_9GAMM
MPEAYSVLAEQTASIAEFQLNPMAVVAKAEGYAVAVLAHNEPVFYCVPAKAYEALINYMDDLELAALVVQRAKQRDIEVQLNDL